MSRVCDGIIDCQYGNDEFFCPKKSNCPINCICDNLINIQCKFMKERYEIFNWTIDHKIKTLNISGLSKSSKLSLKYEQYLTKLIIINSFIKEFPLKYFLNIVYLDLSRNQLESINFITEINKTLNIQYLDLSYNKFIINNENVLINLKKLIYLKMNGIVIEKLTKKLLNLKKLKILQISFTKLFSIDEYSFENLLSLEELSLNKTVLQKHLSSNLLKNLKNLKYLHSTSFYFCCLAKKLNKNLKICSPSSSLIKTCSDLIGNFTLRVIIWIMLICGLCGNTFVISIRILYYKPINIIYLGLHTSDLFFNIYLTIIAIIDQYYKGNYIENDNIWRYSLFCSITGIISNFAIISSNFSLIIITLDRCFVVLYTLQYHKYFYKSVHFAFVTIFVNIISLILSIIPVLSFTVCSEIMAFIFENNNIFLIFCFQDYYSRSAVCLSLHITSEKVDGWLYSFINFSILSLVQISFIIVLYGFMIKKIFKSRLINKSQFEKRMKCLVRSSLFVFLSNFICFVPISILGYQF